MSRTERHPANAPNETRVGARRRACGGPGRRFGWCTLGLAFLLAVVPAATKAIGIGGPFELVDQHGQTRTDQDFRGSYMLIYFGFTSCPDTCPTALLKITQALEEFAAQAPAQAKRVVPVFISVDPERDTPQALLSYARHFHPRLVALTGPHEELVRLGRGYGVFFAKVPTGEPAAYLMDHTSFVYLIGPDGKYIEHFESEGSVADLVDALRQHVVVAGMGSS